jgi:uncharacterized LabA/DUF88 family protein
LAKQRVIAYIDGFNLFYGSLKGSPYKWLDIYSLCKALLRPNQELASIKYFSARVSSFKGDLSKTNRQDVYLDVLRNNPKIEVMLGYFSMHPVKMPAVKEFEAGKIKLLDVMKTEEKGTDVNLAVQMVSDAYEDKFDYAMLFSNDSDIAYATEIAHKVCNKFVGLYIDKKASQSRILQKNICYTKRLSPAIFAAHQLPHTVALENGRLLKKPKSW